MSTHLNLDKQQLELLNVSPIDGRYAGKTEPLRAYFSEYALIKYRVEVEVEYFITLLDLKLPQLIGTYDVAKLRSLYKDYNVAEALAIKQIEATTNHDVKAVEYWLRQQFEQLGYQDALEFIHFGLTSQDINNTAIPLSLKRFMQEVYHPALNNLIIRIEILATQWKNVAMLARTHGQPASPTRLGKELKVFSERLKAEQARLAQIPFNAKFGGATGNFNAHHVAYPAVDWVGFGNEFVNQTLGLSRVQYTTQIEPYDGLAAICDSCKRIDNILIDMARDIWQYISVGYFKQKTKVGEVGSSAMPHKVNPIDFENAEGNLGMANAIFEHLSAKLPISRLQRDLTDSTVLRNLGVPFGHVIISFESILKGLGKLELNAEAISADLNNTPEVLAEAIQTILRRERYPDPYNVLKELTRGKDGLTKAGLDQFVQTLAVSDEVKDEIRQLTPSAYVGVLPE